MYEVDVETLKDDADARTVPVETVSFFVNFSCLNIDCGPSGHLLRRRLIEPGHLTIRQSMMAFDHLHLSRRPSLAFQYDRLLPRV